MHKLLMMIIDFIGCIIPILIIIRWSMEPYSYMTPTTVLLYSLPFIIYLILSLISVKLGFDEKAKFEISTSGSIIFTNYLGIYPPVVCYYFRYFESYEFWSSDIFGIFLFIILYILIPIIISVEFFRRVLRRRTGFGWIFAAFYITSTSVILFYPEYGSGVHSAAWAYTLLILCGYPLLIAYFLAIYGVKKIFIKVAERRSTSL